MSVDIVLIRGLFCLLSIYNRHTNRCFPRKEKREMQVKTSPLKPLLLFAATILISAFAVAQSSKKTTPPGTPKPVSGPKLSVLNPAATNTMVARLPLSPRLSTLEGETIYMVDIGWGGPEAGYDVLQVISKRLTQSIPDIKTVVVRKKGSYMVDDPDLWKEIKAKGQAAILGLSC
jgi:hypothetical protein